MPFKKLAVGTLRALGVVLASVGVLAGQHADPTYFQEVPQAAGLNFWHFSGATGEFYFPEAVGSGAALLDFDGDGDLDVYLIQGRSLNPDRGPDDAVVSVPSGWRPGNRLFRNDLVPGGRLRFVDVTDAAGVGHRGVGMGVASGDFDNDGRPDLYVTNFGRNVLFRNLGDGRFEDVTEHAGVGGSGWSTSAAWLDYDRDGWLDLAVVRYVDFDDRANPPCFESAGLRDYCGPQGFRGTATLLFRSLGDGRFREVTSEVGLDGAPGPGLGIVTGDFNGDGWIDLAVANDGVANRLWLNASASSGRRFRESALKHGLAYAADGIARAGMGIAAGDVDGDGREDIVVTNLPTEGFTLFRQERGGLFTDRTIHSGLLRASLPYTGFGVGWIDLENRGIDDLFVANGAVRVIGRQRGDAYPYRERNLLLRNRGGGQGFEDVTDKGGAALAHVEVSRSAVVGDVDNDGGIDVLVTNNNGPARLLRNSVRSRGHWLLVRLHGVETTRDGYGSRVTVRRATGPGLTRTARGDGSYLAANDPRLHFGLGADGTVESVEVEWLGGRCESWAAPGVDRVLVLKQGDGVPCP